MNTGRACPIPLLDATPSTIDGLLLGRYESALTLGRPRCGRRRLRQIAVSVCAHTKTCRRLRQRHTADSPAVKLRESFGMLRWIGDVLRQEIFVAPRPHSVQRHRPFRWSRFLPGLEDSNAA